MGDEADIESDRDGDYSGIGGVFFRALDESDRLKDRLDADFNAGLEAEVAFSTLSSFIYGCGQKLIDRSERERQNRPLDIAVIRACSRLFSDCLGGYVLLRRGLVMPAIPVLRAALETTMQTLMFLERPAMAEEWLKGKQFRPAKVRDLSATAAALYQAMYGRLSDFAHPNVVATLYHTVPLPTIGEAVLYGGWYAPKSAGVTMCEFARLELAFLRVFYASYEQELKALGLLFRPVTADVPSEYRFDTENPPIAWKQFLDSIEHLVEQAEAHFAGLPADQASWAAEVFPAAASGGG